MIKIIKGAVVGLSAALLLTACSNDQAKVSTPVMHDSAIASDATSNEIKVHEKYKMHLKKTKKAKKVKLKKAKVNLAKFCFKDNHSIHYKAEERCK